MRILIQQISQKKMTTIQEISKIEVDGDVDFLFCHVFSKYKSNKLLNKKILN